MRVFASDGPSGTLTTHAELSFLIPSNYCITCIVPSGQDSRYKMAAEDYEEDTRPAPQMQQHLERPKAGSRTHSAMPKTEIVINVYDLLPVCLTTTLLVS